jgi:hypothetical protein
MQARVAGVLLAATEVRWDLGGTAHEGQVRLDASKDSRAVVLAAARPKVLEFDSELVNSRRVSSKCVSSR